MYWDCLGSHLQGLGFRLGFRYALVLAVSLLLALALASASRRATCQKRPIREQKRPTVAESLLLGLGLGLAAGNSLGPALVLLLSHFARSSLQAQVGRKLLGAGKLNKKKKS